MFLAIHCVRRHCPVCTKTACIPLVWGELMRRPYEIPALLAIALATWGARRVLVRALALAGDYVGLPTAVNSMDLRPLRLPRESGLLSQLLPRSTPCYKSVLRSSLSLSALLAAEDHLLTFDPHQIIGLESVQQFGESTTWSPARARP